MEKQKKQKDIFGDIKRGNAIHESNFLGCLVDGVLNNDTTDVYTSDGWCFVDDFLVERVAKIVKATNAKIVCSSSWREGWIETAGIEHPEDNETCFNELVAKLAEFNLHFIDKTPELSTYRKYVHRGREIAAWLEAHKHWNIESFVILDDMDDMDEFTETNLVQTLPRWGISEDNVKEAIEILNRS